METNGQISQIYVHWRLVGDRWEPYTDRSRDKPLILKAFWSVAKSKESADKFFNACSRAQTDAEFEESVGEEFAWFVIYGQEEITNERAIAEICFDMIQDCYFFMRIDDAVESIMQLMKLAHEKEEAHIEAKVTILPLEDTSC